MVNARSLNVGGHVDDIDVPFLKFEFGGTSAPIVPPGIRANDMLES
jgi:hypothetical protein